MDEGGPKGSRLAQRMNEMRLLYRVSTELNAAQEPARIIQVTLDTMDEVFGFLHASIFLFNPATGLLERAASRGESPSRLGSQIRVGSGMVGAAAAKRDIVRFNRSAAPLLPEPEGASGHMAVPMLAKDALVGVLYLQTVRGRPLLKDDEVLVTIVANQSAVALENAQLYEQLEARVQARTAELAQANLQLREAQAELVQSGKMVALGQLAAGLAHETNTPLGAIRSNVDVADRALARLRESPELLEVLATPSSRIERLLDALDDSNRVTREAATRLFSIFQTLRAFARLDNSPLAWTDLHQGLESTIALLAHRLGTRVSILRDYDALPKVLCYASDLNQVFLIVLTNAIEAIDGSGSITLRTRASETGVSIEVTDTGRGIPPEHIERAFDPGFTTKGVGVGTGLSLAIAFRILERHRGRIELSSTPARGTTVRVELPFSVAVPVTPA